MWVKKTPNISFLCRFCGTDLSYCCSLLTPFIAMDNPIIRRLLFWDEPLHDGCPLVCCALVLHQLCASCTFQTQNITSLYLAECSPFQPSVSILNPLKSFEPFKQVSVLASHVTRIPHLSSDLLFYSDTICLLSPLTLGQPIFAGWRIALCCRCPSMRKSPPTADYNLYDNTVK